MNFINHKLEKISKPTHFGWFNLKLVQISRNHKGAIRIHKIALNPENFVLSFLFHLRVQGQMAQRINVALSFIPSGSRDLIEFIFFCAIGFTAGSLGLIWKIVFPSQ